MRWSVRSSVCDFGVCEEISWVTGSVGCGGRVKERCAASWALIRCCGDVRMALALGICDGDGCDGADGG